MGKPVATCNGNLRGAIKALSLVNERLESELQHYLEKTAHQAGLDADRLVGCLAIGRLCVRIKWWEPKNRAAAHRSILLAIVSPPRA